MNIKVIPTESNRAYHVYESPDHDKIDPSIHFGQLRIGIDHYVNSLAATNRPEYVNLSLKGRLELSNRLEAIARNKWKIEKQAILDKPLPEPILSLLQEKKKKAQQKLIKEITYNTELFIAVPLHAWHLFKMPYSKFTVDNLPKELSKKTFPEVVHLRENSKDVIVVGETDMSQSELRLSVEKRNRIISEFIGDDENWFCFFRTLHGIRGTEVPHVGQPHLHFISSAWGVTREYVIQQLTSYRYSLKAETIAFHESTKVI
jgi:hypothetical protein